MTAHKHAALMAEYAKDAAETDKPWERWEWRNGGEWAKLSAAFVFYPDTEYRRKPKPMEFWINVYRSGNNGAIAFSSYDEAVTAASPDCLRKAAHFREVTK